MMTLSRKTSALRSQRWRSKEPLSPVCFQPRLLACVTTHASIRSCSIAMLPAATAVSEPLAVGAGKRKRPTLTGGPEAAMTLASGGADCDDDEIKYGEADDEPTAPQKRLKLPWTVEEDAILLRMRKQYDAGELTSHVAFTQEASDALGGKRTPDACNNRNKRLAREPLPASARPKRVKLDTNAAMDCDDDDADGDRDGAAAVARKINAPLWSPDEDSVLRQLVDRWNANQFASVQSFYNEAVKQLARRTANAIQLHLYRLELTAPSNGIRGGGPFWSQSEDDTLIGICCQCNAGQFASGEQLSKHLAERLPGRSAYACYKQLRKLGHDIPQLLRQIDNAAQRIDYAAAKHDKDGVAVALKIMPPLWSPEEDSVLKHLMSQWRKKQFASAHDFYSEAVKRLQGRSAQAMWHRLRKHCEVAHPPGWWDYKPADQRAAPAQPLAHAAAAADVSAAVKDDISDDAPIPAQPQATLPPPPLWMIRNSASGKTSGPFLISVLRRGVKEGRISAKDVLAWRQDEDESAAISLQAALNLPRIPSRSQQMNRTRTR
jgi:hypothetical protein